MMATAEFCPNLQISHSEGAANVGRMLTQSWIQHHTYFCWGTGSLRKTGARFEGPLILVRYVISLADNVEYNGPVEMGCCVQEPNRSPLLGGG